MDNIATETIHCTIYLPDTPRGPVMDIFAGGASGLVGRIDDTTVCKFAQVYDPTCANDLAIEGQVYERLGKHKNLLEYHGAIKNGIVLERAQSVTALTIDQCMGLVDALRYVHSKGIVHCDIKPDNVLLGEDGNAKLIDFGGSSVDGSEPTVSARGEYFNEALKFPSPEADMYALSQTILKLSGVRVDTQTCQVPEAREQWAALSYRCVFV